MENQEVAIKQETEILTAQADAFVIKTQVDYENTAGFLSGVKALQKKIKACFDPIVSTALQAHRVAVAKRKEHLDPAMKAEKIVKDKLIDYTEHQEIIRRAKQEQLDRQARAEEERKKKALEERARKAEEQGKADKAAELREKKEDVQVDAPIAAPRVAAPSGLTFKTSWYAEVTDKMALIKAVAEGKALPTLLDANMSNLNKQASMYKDQVTIPGINFKSKKVASSR